MSRRKREIDVIDVNRQWTVFVGTRRHGHSVGIVTAADDRFALQEARKCWPTLPRIFVEECTP